MKSYADFYLQMVIALYTDIANCYSVSSKTREIEIEVIRSRFSREGLSFLTITLPMFGKAFDKVLSSGTQLKLVGWKTGKSSLPRFLGWLTSRVLNSDGFELVRPDPIAVKHFRAFVYLLYKLEIPYAPKKAKAVLDAFTTTEEDLGRLPLGHLQSRWIDDASDFITRVVSPLDPHRIKPRHGPGAVATRENTLDKSVFKRIYKSLEKVYPFFEWMRFNLEHVNNSWVDDQRDLKEEDYPIARVVLVPKDSRGPRLISCEPLEIQWIQQGLGTLVRNQIETSRFTRGHVNFVDQSVNRRLALAGSKGSGWVTLDMKEASDRVSLQLVERLFAGHPGLLEALRATRSHSTMLPDGRVVHMRKFAPMGSNLCFPVESLVFYALAVSAIKQTGLTWRKSRDSVYVYGDDIIVKDEVYAPLIQLFPTVGLMFNDSKCCVARFFRESCGCDAYDGVDVTPIKLKTTWSRSRYDSKYLAAYVAFSNAMYGMGYYHTADYVKSELAKRGFKFPFTNKYTIASNGAYITHCSGLAYASRQNAQLCNRFHKMKSRFNLHLHYWEYASWGSSPKKVKTQHDGYPELLRRYSDGYGAHGGVYALTRRNRLKRVWTEV